MPDREKYIKVLSKTVKTVKEYNEDAPIKISLECVEDILELLKEQPQIVRCKDCKYCFVEGFVHEHNICDKHEWIQGQPDDWYCADGERQDDNA
jgi:hypothetical protein